MWSQKKIFMYNERRKNLISDVENRSEYLYRAKYNNNNIKYYRVIYTEPNGRNDEDTIDASRFATNNRMLQ